jgi:diacylglycerol diphosphate phosphatase/phosphatidate phosphatase
MGLFSRRAAADPVNGNSAAPIGHHAEKHDGAFEPHMNRRPSFGQWMRSAWLDILTMAILGAIGLGV